MRILIVDPSGLLHGGELSAALATAGHQVQLAHDGIQALRAARGWPAQLVVASVHQPRMDGLALTAALRALGGAAAPAVVLCGSDADHHARTRGRELGVAAYLPLPLEVTSLLQATSRVERAALGPAAPQLRRGTPGPRRRAG